MNTLAFSAKPKTSFISSFRTCDGDDLRIEKLDKNLFNINSDPSLKNKTTELLKTVLSHLNKGHLPLSGWCHGGYHLAISLEKIVKIEQANEQELQLLTKIIEKIKSVLLSGKGDSKYYSGNEMPQLYYELGRRSKNDKKYFWNITYEMDLKNYLENFPSKSEVFRLKEVAKYLGKKVPKLKVIFDYVSDGSEAYQIDYYILENNKKFPIEKSKQIAEALSLQQDNMSSFVSKDCALNSWQEVLTSLKKIQNYKWLIKKENEILQKMETYARKELAKKKAINPHTGFIFSLPKSSDLIKSIRDRYEIKSRVGNYNPQRKNLKHCK